MKACPIQGYSFFLLPLLALIFIACQADQTTPELPDAASATSPPNSPTVQSPNPSTSLPSAPLRTGRTGPSVSPAPNRSTPQPATPTPVTPTGDIALLGLAGQPESLNPILDNDPALRELRPLLFETLLQIDPQTAELKPGLAQSWSYSHEDNRQQVIFRLPPNLTWSDGAPLNAAAIADSLRATQHPALRAFSQIRAIDEETLSLTFNQVNCSAVTTVAQLPLLPAEAITATRPIGSGPFVVTEWSDNKRALTLARNPNYHGSPPRLGGLIIRFLGEDELKIAQSEGQFDLIGPSLSLRESANPQRFEIVTYPAPQVVYMALNFAPKNDPPLDPKVRQALLLALDREAILNEVLAGDGQLMPASLLPSHWAANNDLSPPDYAPDIAKNLLREVGLRDRDGDGWLEQDGERLELSLRVHGRNELQQNLAWLVSDYYRALGILARAEGVGFDSVVDDLFTHDFTTAIFSWPILPDPDQQLYWRSTENSEGFGLNFSSYSNPGLDRLLNQANSVTNCAPPERAEIYAGIQEILARDRPVDFLLTPNQHLLVAGRLQGLQPGPFAPLTWNVINWFLKE